MTPLESYQTEVRRARDVEVHAKSQLLIMQRSCSHPASHTVEAPYCNYGDGYSNPPFAVCTLCGYSETGWGAGYWRLHGDGARRVTRDKGIRLAVPRVMTQEDQADERYGRGRFANGAKPCHEP